MSNVLSISDEDPTVSRPSVSSIYVVHIFYTIVIILKLKERCILSHKATLQYFVETTELAFAAGYLFIN